MVPETEHVETRAAAAVVCLAPTLYGNHIFLAQSHGVPFVALVFGIMHPSGQPKRSVVSVDPNYAWVCHGFKMVGPEGLEPPTYRL